MVKDVTHPKFHRHKVHWVLAHSYFMYLILFFFGVSVDLIFQFRMFQNPIFAWIGWIFLIFASGLIVWAQMTSRNLKIENMSKENFSKGPYHFTRCPTHWGLFFLMIGFGMIVNAFFVVLFTVMAFVLTKLIFVKKEELLLIEKYGAPYLEYKKSVRF